MHLVHDPADNSCCKATAALTTYEWIDKMSTVSVQVAPTMANVYTYLHLFTCKSIPSGEL